MHRVTTAPTPPDDSRKAAAYEDKENILWWEKKSNAGAARPPTIIVVADMTMREWYEWYDMNEVYIMVLLLWYILWYYHINMRVCVRFVTVAYLREPLHNLIKRMFIVNASS